MQSKKNKTWTREETVAAVRYIVSSGGDDALLAKTYGSTPEVWRARCKRFGILTPSQHVAKQRKLAAREADQKVIECLLQGYSQADAARKNKVHPSRVTRLAAKAGTPRRHRIRKKDMPERDRRIVESAKSASELAEEFGCSVSNIKRIRLKYRNSK